jgi:site-specific DNA-methyltransferase (adenine-specific)
MTLDDMIGKIICGDCLELMKDIPDKSIDLTVTSPPYNMRTRVRNREYTKREWSDNFSKKYNYFGDDLPIQEYYDFYKLVISELLRISKMAFINIQILTGSKEAWFMLIGDYAKYIKDVIIWDKGEGQPAMHPSVINRGSELILIFEADAKAGRAFNQSYFNRGEMSDIWRYGRGGNGNVDGHGAVFNIDIVKKILKGWSLPNNLIIDPFSGSCTTAVACKLLNRRCISIEISPEYCAIGEKRLRNTLYNEELAL